MKSRIILGITRRWVCSEMPANLPCPSFELAEDFFGQGYFGRFIDNIKDMLPYLAVLDKLTIRGNVSGHLVGSL